MPSGLFVLKTFHKRFRPKVYQLAHRYFSFWVDVDEIDQLASKYCLISRNRFNLYSFYDSDHFPGIEGNIKSKLLGFVQANCADPQLEPEDTKVWMLTSFRVFGYVFNPVTLYFCQSPKTGFSCAVVEVENTFHEIKPYYLPATPGGEYEFESTQPKEFYVSPFGQLDQSFHFKLNWPDTQLFAGVDSVDAEGVVLMSTLSGTFCPLSSWALLKLTIRYPLVPIAVIMMIHWHAFCLWMRKLPFLPKQAYPELQTQILRPYKG